MYYVVLLMRYFPQVMPMDTTTVSTAQIQEDIDRLRTQFPRTRDLYREVCVLLFFRYGITPTANKLYQYVRKGSMSAPAEALNHFWLELRDKSRVRIEHPDLPTKLTEVAGKFMGELWHQARDSAQANFSIQIAEANEQIALAQRETIAERELRSSTQAELDSTTLKLKNALQQLAKSEKNRAVDISTLAGLEKSLKTLQNEREQLERALEAARKGFSDDIDKVNVALNKAEERYRALEARSLLETDRERQVAKKLERDNSALRAALRDQDRLHMKELASTQKMISNIREQLGVASGQVRELKRQQRGVARKMASMEKKLRTSK
jgi:DNA repair exonuclease SbcCD ATPase subunit